MRPEEREEKRYVKKIEELGFCADKYEVHGKKGAPDRMITRDHGFICFIEFKRPGGGKVSPHQQDWIDRLVRWGFDAKVFDNWKEALEWTKHLYTQKALTD